MSPTSIWRAGIATSVAVLVLLSADALAAPVSGWHKVDLTARQGRFLSLAPVGQQQAWAVGLTPTHANGGFAPLIARWNGASWTAVALPAKVRSRLGPLAALYTAAASGPRSLWAFSVTGDWLHYNGSSWATGIVPGAFAVTASAATRKGAWFFGLRATFHNPVPFSAYATDSRGTVTWTSKAIPGGSQIYDASAVSGSDLWAVGNSGRFTDAANSGAAGSAIAARVPATTLKSVTATSHLLHYYGGRWHQAKPLPAAMRKNAAYSILARSDTDIWVGGAVENARTGTTEAIAHWTGRNWSLVKLPARASKADYGIEAITPDGSGGLWALAGCDDIHCPHGQASRLWHQQAGHWTGPIQPVLSRYPTVLLTLASAGRSVWAAGVVRVGKSDLRGLIAGWSTPPASRPK